MKLARSNWPGKIAATRKAINDRMTREKARDCHRKDVMRQRGREREGGGEGERQRERKREEARDW